jgi:transcriptional regulator of stress and heat shock response
MARLSDIIEEIIKQMIEENHGYAVISRSLLAEKVNCVPSQITYVLSTRFTNGQGYIVESRRGGGGEIRVARVQRVSSTDYLMHTVNSLGNDLSQQEADIYLRNFLDYGIVKVSQASLMNAALSDQSLVSVDADKKGVVRLEIFKNMLVSMIVSEGYRANFREDI